MDLLIKGLRLPRTGYHEAALIVWGDGTSIFKLKDGGGYPCIPVKEKEAMANSDSIKSINDKDTIVEVIK